MPNTLQAAYRLADRTAEQITGSYEQYMAFLRTAARLYKYPYSEQLMIFAQRPDATACAEYGVWNERMGRYIRHGSRGIALIDVIGDTPRLRYVFDVADTGTREHSRSVSPWELQPEDRGAVAAALSESSGVPAGGSLEDQLERIAVSLAGEYWNEHQFEILHILDGSFLEDYDDFSIGAQFRSAAAVSITYALLYRCGLAPEEYFKHEDFLNIFDFNTPTAAVALGTAVSESTQRVLRQIEVTVRKMQRERSTEHERTDVHEQRGLPHSRPQRAGSGADREIRQDATGLPTGEPARSLEQPRPLGEAVPAVGGDRRGGAEPSRAADAGPRESGGRDGGAEGVRPDEVDGPDERLPGSGGGSDLQRADIQLTPEEPEPAQLTLFPMEAEQIRQIDEAESEKPSAFSISQDDIDDVLRAWNGDPDSKRAAGLYLSAHSDDADAAAWLAREYGAGDTKYLFVTRTGSDAVAGLSWTEVRDRIAELIREGRFLSDDELEITPDERREQITRAMDAAGYHFDEIGSDNGYLVFEGETERLRFDNWAGAAVWLDGVVFDDPERSEAVERILFPERYQLTDKSLHEREESTDREYQTAVAALPEERQRIVRAMEELGLRFNFRSHSAFGDEAVSFTPADPDHGYPQSFSSWEEAFEWADEAPFDKVPGLRKRVQAALHPERRSCAVGDTVYLEGKPYVITQLRDATVQLRDPALAYSIFRAEDRERLNELLRLDERNAAFLPAPPALTDVPITREGDTITLGGGEPTHKVDVELSDEQWAALQTAVPETAAETPPEPAPFEAETVAVYPAEQNHLPYDIVVEKLHTPEREVPQNFRITDVALGVGGPKEKFQANIAAIRTLQSVEREQRPATPEEQETLSRYVGWGGLADAFDAGKAAWSAEYAELQGLLTPEEYASARASTLNAHYTSPTVIRAIYEAVGNIGFKVGNILEPSMGVGNFFGLLPEAMRDSRLYGVELDSVTGRIARLLYPDADITVAGFETTDRRDFFDLAVGNVPFGQYQVNDSAYNRLGFSIHDYFFAKTLDQVRPGGVIAFVTSRYTMDKQSPEVRRYIAQRAELLGAIRLPNNAFRANAGADVVSDILFLQKRDRPVIAEPDWVHLAQNADGFSINSYFVDHPGMILGRQTSESTQYGREDFTVEPIEGLNLADQLHEAVQNIGGQYAEAELPELGEDEPVDTSIPADPNVKNYSYTLVNGEVYYRENSRMVKPTLNATAAERVKGMVGLRDCVHALIELQLEDFTPASAIAEKQAELSRLYDAFSAKYGLLNDRANRLAFSDDSAYYLLCSLEVLDEDGRLERRADMFTKRTIKQHSAITSVDTASEALTVSLAERARVDLPFMSQLCDKSEDAVAAELRGVIFRSTGEADPADIPIAFYDLRRQPFVTADEYLSGNVRRKLAAAEYLQQKLPPEQAAELAPNVEVLRAAQPKDLDASEIEVRLGAMWIDKAYIQQFMEETFEPPYYLRRAIRVSFSAFTAEWNVTGKSSVGWNDVAACVTYGTDRANAYKILEDSLNLRDVRIYDTVQDPDGKERRVLNAKETTLAQQKQQAIRHAFKDWIWRDPERRQTLVARYNELFNSTRPREYDGGSIRFAGMNPEIELREHQKNAVAHILYGGNALLAHEVGAGKTFEMAAACMEAKRLGLSHKALFAVPNHLTEQWASEFLRLYPSANILVATKKDFETRSRQKFCARIATGDYDAVILGHSQFEKIPVSQERQERLLQEQIDEITEGIAELKNSRAENFTIKQMEHTKKSLEVRLEKLQATERKDDVVTFEELGVDRLFVDEAHSYKNGFVYTKMRNVAGLSTSDAQKSSDMLLKCRYMDELTGSRGVVFATGTPVSNSMTELYVMQRYLQHDMLKENGLVHFDAWASTFGETTTAIELAPEGTGYRARTRFAKFFNLPELMNLFKEVADIKTADQLDLPTPEAVYHNVVAEPTELQKHMVQELSERAAVIHAGNIEPTRDNMLKITSDGRKLGLDQRVINPNLPDDPGSKVNQCVENIYRIWDEGQAKKLTQLVFCDLSTPKTAPAKKAENSLDSPEVHAVLEASDADPEPGFTVYDDIREKLVARGVPREQIAFIHEANTELRKKELFAKVRAGQVRVLMGSTFKMGAGMNVQDRLVALHDLDAPWRPGDLEQRSGRIIRQGNRNEKVHIFRYVTEGTFDSYLWQTLENKQKFISQIMTSKSPVRSCEDIDETALSYAEIKALCAGDPRIREKMDLDIDVARLRLMQASHRSQQYRLEDNLLRTYPELVEQHRGYIAGFEADMQTLAANPRPKDGFAGMEVHGVCFTDKDKAGAAVLAACKAVKTLEPVPLGSYRGFAMSLEVAGFTKDYVLTLKGKMSHRVELGSDARGNLTRIDNALAAMPERLAQARSSLDNVLAQTEAAKAELGKPFPQEAELTEKSARLAALNAELNIDERAPEPAEELEKSPRPSVLEALKVPGVHGAGGRTTTHKMEVTQWT